MELQGVSEGGLELTSDGADNGGILIANCIRY